MNVTARHYTNNTDSKANSTKTISRQKWFRIIICCYYFCCCCCGSLCSLFYSVSVVVAVLNVIIFYITAVYRRIRTPNTWFIFSLHTHTTQMLDTMTVNISQNRYIICLLIVYREPYRVLYSYLGRYMWCINPIQVWLPYERMSYAFVCQCMMLYFMSIFVGQ